MFDRYECMHVAKQEISMGFRSHLCFPKENWYEMKAYLKEAGGGEGLRRLSNNSSASILMSLFKSRYTFMMKRSYDFYLYRGASLPSFVDGGSDFKQPANHGRISLQCL